MVTLKYYDGKEWLIVGEYANMVTAWVSLGSDTFGYRVVDVNGKILIQNI